MQPEIVSKTAILSTPFLLTDINPGIMLVVAKFLAAVAPVWGTKSSVVFVRLVQFTTSGPVDC